MPLTRILLSGIEESMRVPGVSTLIPLDRGGHFEYFPFPLKRRNLNSKLLKKVIGRVGVVAITLASHARGREFNPRIRYF